MEPNDTPVVELEDSEDLDIRLGVDLAAEEVAPHEDEPDPEAPPVPSRLAVGHATVHEDFEDGSYYASQKTKMRVPPRIMEEDGRKFLRITGSATDIQSIPSRLVDQLHRSRSTVTFTSHYSQMPGLEPHTIRQTYRARMRIDMKQSRSHSSCFEMFQNAPGGAGAYGTQDGCGPPARFMVINGRIVFETRYRNETQMDQYDLKVDWRQWQTYELIAIWSHNPGVSRLEVRVDGQLKCTVRGRDVNLGPLSNCIPMVKCGLYGDNLAGSTVDVDFIQCAPTGSEGPVTPPTQPPVTPKPEPEPEPERRTRAANCGGVAYTATDATVYAADKGFTGGRKETMTNLIASTEDGPLYQSWRYGKKFEYSAPFANGPYTLTLHFAEHLHTEAGTRVFDVEVEGQPVLTRLDVFAQVGAKTAYVVEIPVMVTDQALTVAFEALAGNAMVSAIKVEPR